VNKQPTTLPTNPQPSIEVYLATFSPAIGAALAAIVLTLAATNLTALVWGFCPSPRWIAAGNRGLAKRSTAILGAVLLAVAVPPLLPGWALSLRALLGLVSGAVAGPLYDLLRPFIEAKTGLKFPQSLTTKGDKDATD